ncbi:hypothetical protein [Aquipuribacter hungaricus]|uniref:F5/8 type C domain-containing protein n=1 Tax=Aquipuribacter hungaricus TaxID=545624 RepID=A0ABV7WFK0_9MICO
MRTRTWLPATAGVLLLLGVLTARGGTAADEADLRPPAAEASPAPSEPAGPEVTVLEADGVPTARLGMDVHELADAAGGPGFVGLEEAPPEACLPVWATGPDSMPAFETSAWVRDGEVVAVVLSRWDTTTRVVAELETWLGPTLGSPVATASELPGARTTLERPFGAAGPTVTVVHVPAADGVEVVYADVSSGYQPGAGAGAGRITSVEVRSPGGRGCSQDAHPVQPEGRDGAPVLPPLVMGLDGLDVAPLGSPSAGLAALGFEGGLGGGPAGCEAFWRQDADGSWLSVTALDGVVVKVEGDGPTSPSLGVGAGDSLKAVLRAYPGAVGQGLEAAWATWETTVGQRVVRIDVGLSQRYAADVDLPVMGPPSLVQSVSVRDVATDPNRFC